MKAIGRYWHTLRYLKPIQIWGRLWFKLYRPGLNLSPPSAPRTSTGAWQLCPRTQSMYGPATFRFLNQQQSISDPGDWQRDDLPALWRYHLHYFDDLNASDADTRRALHTALIERWVCENPPAQGTGWEPYPVSLRMVNWIKWRLGGGSLDAQALHSLAIQTRWLQKRLEVHLLGNHLWANAKALIFAGMFFDGEEADGWREHGLSILMREIPDQILADGGQFERSPMYHATVLEDLLDLVQLSDRYPGVIATDVIAHWREYIPKMFHWLESMTHPDGEIAFFNDATLGAAPNLAALTAYAGVTGMAVSDRSDDGLIHLNESGYVRMQSADAVVMADVGEIGPDYLPGHAHADTLSFEMSIFGGRLIVNSGIDRYGTDAERVRQRGTSTHNTVEVDGEDSSEVWSGFRVARRAYPFDLVVRTDVGSQYVACSHDGYRRLPGRVVHRREWTMDSGSLKVLDKLEGKFNKAVSRFYLHPDVQVIHVREDGCMLGIQGRRIELQVTGGAFTVMDTKYFPGFGVTVPNKGLQVDISGNICEAIFNWGGK